MSIGEKILPYSYVQSSPCSPHAQYLEETTAAHPRDQHEIKHDIFFDPNNGIAHQFKGAEYEHTQTHHVIVTPSSSQ